MLDGCSLYCTKAMNPYNSVAVGFGDVSQLFEVWCNEFWSALANDAEHLGCLHTDTVVAVV